MTFSSLFDIVCPFTRDYDLIKSKLLNIEFGDKTCIESALHGVNNYIFKEWGKNTPCKVIMITDGNPGFGKTSLASTIATINQRKAQGQFTLPFMFPGELHIVCIAPSDDPNLIQSYASYQQLIDLVSHNGTFTSPEGQINFNSIAQMFQKLAEEIYLPFKATLKCGHIESKVIVTPTPSMTTVTNGIDRDLITISKTLEICGFFSIADIGSPISVSRHLILQLNHNKELNESSLSTHPNKTTKTITENTESTEMLIDETDERNIPSFCVLLHGSLKFENSAALILLAPNWFGLLYPFADTKKKSNLILTILPYGLNSIPWLGNFHNLSIKDIITDTEIINLPLKINDKKSYSQNFVTWVKSSSLQSDIQKVLRHARKLPEKTQQFYKVCKNVTINDKSFKIENASQELNKLRRAAISYGFLEVIGSLTYIFEYECSVLNNSLSNNECIIQLSHVINELRQPNVFDVKYTLNPVQTKIQ